MALLQISEPGETPDPHARRMAIGIDLGTTHSLVAAMRNGVAECLPDADGHVLLPSAVRYGAEGRRSIGEAALSQATADPHNTVVSAKRWMGRRLADIVDADRLPYRFVDREGMVGIETADGVKTPVDAAAEILATLRQRAEDTFGDDVFGAVVTVPAYFDDAQRQATKDAARLAGLHVLRLINEPTAAAVAYGLDRRSEGLHAVYDLGGGTFDISLLRMTRGVFEVVATGGDAALGGDNYDHRIADLLLDRASLPQLGDLSAGDKRRVLGAARAAKHALSSSEAAAVDLALDAGRLQTRLGAEEVDAATADLTRRTVELMRGVLRDAGVRRDEIDGAVMVGGSTRMPAVRRAVAEFFGHEPLVDADPDRVVALGAAIQADALAGNARHDDGLLLLDVIPLSLGIETMGGLVERIVERNTTIPVAKAQEFTTFKDGQTAMAIHVVQGERELVADCRSLARFELRGIPPMTAGAARIRVEFQVDADGLLGVSARETTTGVEASVAVKPSYGLGDDEIASMLQQGFAAAESDVAARALREARVDAERLVAATRSALAADGDLLSSEERSAIDVLLNATIAVATQEDRTATESAVEALGRGTEAFAAVRMNRHIRRALAGRRVDTL